MDTLPEFENVRKSLCSLNKSSVVEIKAFANPPPIVKSVMEAVCILLDKKRDWISAKSLLADSNTFLSHLLSYDVNSVSDAKLKKLKTYIDNPKFLPEEVAKVSIACQALCGWVRAIEEYARTHKNNA